MLEPRKISLLNILLNGKIPSKIIKENPLRPSRSSRRPKPAPAKLWVNPEQNGAKVLLQKDSSIPKFQTLAFVANNGHITYYIPESEISSVHKSKIQRLGVQASLGKKISK